MRSALVAAAIAAGALAVPVVERAVEYTTDIVYATKLVTVTAGDVAPTDAPAPAPSSSSKKHWGHRKPKTSSAEQPQGYGWTSTWATTWTESVPASSASPVQDQAPPAYSAPAYSSSEEQTPAYTSSEAPAPSSYEAPSSSYQPAPSSSEAAPPASSAADADPKPTDYQSTVTYHHNVHRYNHSSPALSWNDSLASTAQKIGNTCNYAHMMTMDGGGYGQNIAAGVESSNISAVITELFYNAEERAYYDAGNYGKGTQNEDANGNSVDGFDNDDFHVWGHFSQIVWSNTTTVGCATVDCSAKGLASTGGNVAPYFTVCNYYPAGNYRDSYAYSVKKPRGDDTCHWNDGQ